MNNRRTSFKEFLEQSKDKTTESLMVVELQGALVEHKQYKDIPNSTCSYRKDAANTNTKTQQHVHVFAKRNGGGKELYALNADGSGHDGNTGTKIPATHADHFRSLGYGVPSDNILEHLDIGDFDDVSFVVLISHTEP